MSNYERIKAMAKQCGVSYRSLIALSPQNDPFYSGTEGDIEKAEWFADLWHRAGYTSGVHLRKLHYWAVSKKPQLPRPITWDKKRRSSDVYVNNDACWKYLCLASKMARYLGYVRVEDVADKKSPAPHVNADYRTFGPDYYIQAPDLDNWYVSVSGFNKSIAQPYHLEVWCEKSTMDDVLRPVCSRYLANLVTFEGEVSVTACHKLIERVRRADKPARIFYISDFDPAGNSMPVAMSRKVEFLSQDLDLDIRVDPLVLTLDQVQHYQLPRVPIKESETRAASFEDAFGAGAVELDALEALHSGSLRRIVSDALSDYYSEEAREETRRKERELRAEVQRKVDVVTSQYADQLEALRDMIAALNAVSVDLADYQIKPHEPKADEPNGWLFDSQRDYTKQIGYYKAHKQA